MKNTYILIRHSYSDYSTDDRNRPLSTQGIESLRHLKRLDAYPIDYFFSSPYKRAFDTVSKYFVDREADISLDERLIERKVSSSYIGDDKFLTSIEYLWENPDESFAGGESNNEALQRILAFVKEMEQTYNDKTILVSSHGNLIGILLHFFDERFGFTE